MYLCSTCETDPDVFIQFVEIATIPPMPTVAELARMAPDMRLHAHAESIKQTCCTPNTACSSDVDFSCLGTTYLR